MFRLDSQPGERPNGWPPETTRLDVPADVERADEDRPAGEKLVPKPAPGLGPIGPAGDPAYMEGTLAGPGPRRGFILTVAIMAALVLAAIALLLGG
ncbi:MAG TPA: hypothetical protein VIC59_10890 [Gemmatimonadota bacterium]|jgi:hypothetical protein